LTNPLEFILAGKATFTVQNTETQNRFTYKVERKTENLHFVSIMTGPSNTNDFTYLGSIRNKVYKHGRKSDIKGSAQSAIVFEWLWAKLMKGDLPEEVAIFHEGRCGRCGRKLTTPESVTAGFGPHCAKEIGISSPVTLSSGDTELSKVSGHETDLEPTVAK
jgi:formylmethanofuran dehydrogenase subunit E